MTIASSNLILLNGMIIRTGNEMSYYEEPQDDEPTDDMMFRREFWIIATACIIILAVAIYFIVWG